MLRKSIERSKRRKDIVIIALESFETAFLRASAITANSANIALSHVPAFVLDPYHRHFVRVGFDSWREIHSTIDYIYVLYNVYRPLVSGYLSPPSRSVRNNNNGRLI